MPLDPATVPVPKRRTGLAVLAALGVGALTYACKIDPERPVLHYSLSEETTRLGDDGLPVIPEKVQAHIEGSLGMLFGTAANPQYMLLEEWLDDGYDPNYPTYPEDDMGSGELAGDEAREMLSEANRQSFHRQLALIEEERYEDVRVPDHMVELAAYWNEELLPAWQARDEEGSELDRQEFQEQAAYAFLDWYPTLRESAELYRVQCVHCHGAEGGGDGPTAEFLNPLPRDYRHTFRVVELVTLHAGTADAKLSRLPAAKSTGRTPTQHAVILVIGYIAPPIRRNGDVGGAMQLIAGAAGRIGGQYGLA
jgi:hypothetical protein